MLSAHLMRGLGATAAVLALTVGCTATRSRTRVTDQWTDPSAAARPMNTLVVLAPNVPDKTRRELEDRFVSELGEEGVKAQQSYKILGDQPFDRDLARARLLNSGWDGALVIEFETVESSTTAAQQSSYISPYHQSWPSQYQSPHLTTQYTMNIDTSVWDLRNDKKVWDATTKVENPTSRRDLAKRMSKKVVEELAGRGMLGQTSR